MAKVTFNVCITEEDDGSFWTKVEELPGCFASGFSLDEVKEATEEAIQLYLPDGISLGKAIWGPLEEDDPKPPGSGHGSTRAKKPGTRPRHRRVLIHA